MGTIVDRATAAAQAEVCSLYLMDRDGTGVTLAATNGLDPEQINVARLPLGVGITGAVAQTRKPATSLNVHRDRRFHWVRGVDEPRFTSMCSVPLVWNDAVVGVLNVQTVRRREFTRRDVSFLETLAALLAGIVERNRLQREAEAQVESLRAIDEARANLVAVVTHALANATGSGQGVRRAARWRRAAARRGRSGSRPTRHSGSARRSSRWSGSTRPSTRSWPACAFSLQTPGRPSRSTWRPRSTRRRRSWHRSCAGTSWPWTS